MAKRYIQLSLEERCTIARLHEAGQSLRQISAALGRAPSTLAREMKRNRGAQVGYRPAYAEEQAWARRWRGSRMQRDTGLRADVLARLRAGHSPEQVSGRLALERGRAVISAESIYRFLYSQIRRTGDTDWRNYLPRRKYKRGYRRPFRDRSPFHLIPARVPIAERPPEIDARARAGDWEADLMLFSTPGQVLLLAQERASRMLLLDRHTTKAANPIAQSLRQRLGGMPPQMRRSLTLDNGAEFTHHRLLHGIGVETYFCDKHAPWQKGGIENAIGRLRRALPRKSLPAELNPKRLKQVVDLYNQTPRKCLGFFTPAELFNQYLLHFKCESTPSLRSG